MINKSNQPTVPRMEIDVRIRLAFLWFATMLIFLYVDLFTLFRADVLSGIAAGKINGIATGQGFLLFAIVYVTIPVIMAVVSLFLEPRITRITTIVTAAVYAVSIALFCIGERWGYYFFGSIVELFFLGLIMHQAIVQLHPNVRSAPTTI